MTEVAIKQANDAFSKQISAQVARITGELNRLEQLLSAGMVDRRGVAEFWDAVDKGGKNSWEVQCWMEGGLQNLPSSLVQERIPTASQLANTLASHLQDRSEKFSGVSLLKESIQKLDQVLGKQ